MAKTTNSDAEARALEALTPKTHPARDASRKIVEARKEVDAANASVRRAVAEAREAGDSWTIIGVALDTTRQAAFQRFGKSA
jgi:hypothetical protein